MKIAIGVTGLIAGSIALAGCSKPVQPTPPPSEPVKTAAPVTGSPSDSCPTGITATETVTMKVNSAFHVIFRAGPTGIPNTPHTPPGQLDVYTSIVNGQYAQITITLTGKESFDGGNTAFQLKPNQDLIFCGVTVSNNGKQLDFFTFRKPGLQTSATYSLAVLVPDNENPHAGDPALRVIIDPVVDNNGFGAPAPPPPTTPPTTTTTTPPAAPNP